MAADFHLHKPCLMRLMANACSQNLSTQRSDVCPHNFGIRWASWAITHKSYGRKIYGGAPRPLEFIRVFYKT
jgi:hypothetical protein